MRSGPDAAPPGWERDLRRAAAGARPEQAASRVLRFDFDLGHFGRWLGAHLDRPLETTDDGPNTLNAHGRSLELAGLTGLGALVRETLLEPLRRTHFADVVPESLDADYSYLIEYGEHGDLDLPLHVDASHMTFNLCLGDDFEGGELVFEGLRCEAHREVEPALDELHAFEHAPGRAFVHLGAHRHKVAPVTLGRRRNLIVWGRRDGSETLGGNGPCRPWCGRDGRSRGS